MPRKPRKPEEIYNKILHSAIELYSERGCRDVSMDDVAKNIHMSKRTLYETFSDKAELLKACCQSIQRHIEDSIRNLFGEVQEPLMLTLYLVKLRAIHVIRYSKLFDDLVCHYPDLLHQYFTFMDSDKLDQAREDVEKMLDRAQKEGDIIYYINTKEITHMLFSMGTIAMSLYPGSAKMQDVCISMLCFTIMRGCLSQQALKRYDDLEAEHTESPKAYLSLGSLDDARRSSINKYLEVFNNTPAREERTATSHQESSNGFATDERNHTCCLPGHKSKQEKTTALNTKATTKTTDTVRNTSEKEKRNAKKSPGQKYDTLLIMQSSRKSKGERQHSDTTNENA